MDKADLVKLHRLCCDNGLPGYQVIVALHIAMDSCDNPQVIAEYGTIACDALRKSRDVIDPRLVHFIDIRDTQSTAYYVAQQIRFNDRSRPDLWFDESKEIQL